jgi:hypothetical protein
VRRAPAVLALLLVAGCGVSSQDAPVSVPTERLPAAAGTPSAGRPGVTSTGVLYLCREDQLEPVEFLFDGQGVAGRISALLIMPAPPEGLRTAIPAGTRLEGAQQDGAVVTLELSEQVFSVRGPDRQLALAQLVYTATEVPGVQGVRMSVNGSVVPLPDQSGRLVERPLQRKDLPSPAGKDVAD